MCIYMYHVKNNCNKLTYPLVATYVHYCRDMYQGPSKILIVHTTTKGFVATTPFLGAAQSKGTLTNCFVHEPPLQIHL
jgi:hypothetical protein